MTPTARYQMPPTMLAHNAVAASPCLGKRSHYRSLGEDPGAFERRSRDRRVQQSTAATCQIEPREFAPLWHGPRLRPAFIAQVIGQVTTDHIAPASNVACDAYRRGAAQVRSTGLFDDSL